MAGRPTMRDVAAAAGVSHQTVSRVVNDERSVTEPVRERVRAAITALGYRPSAGGRAMARGRTEVVALVVPHAAGFTFGNDHLMRLIGGAEQEVAARGYGLLLSTREPGGDAMSAFTRFDRRSLVDGFLVEGGAGLTGLSDLLAQGYPAVVIGYADDDLPMVHPDDEGGAYAVVQHLLALGHRRIGIVNGPAENHLAMAARRTGVTRAFADAHLHPDPTLTDRGDFTAESGQAAAVRLFDRADPPTAVFAFNDGMALGVLQWLRESGTPGISVAGFDDTSAAPVAGLTSVALQSQDLGRRAAQLLVDQLNGKPPSERRTIVPSRLMVRSSTTPPTQPKSGSRRRGSHNVKG
ncbi:LacI family DNA-binding transcriptional regulator [Kribbella sp.]|uniref:LacI family DNA-binding transcriptional regulator n=1 Tax=Kribbella sp. TaxID=1871183 RepID=UPI002D3274B2|nr:LacI family DNA-binding transcriptional regulator [Kribbella sp.]HZX03248.1 LacI family DNA-binding transcriptional regulator [Kribbella sp.]